MNLVFISYGESWRNYYEADPVLSLPNSKRFAFMQYVLEISETDHAFSLCP